MQQRKLFFIAFAVFALTTITLSAQEKEKSKQIDPSGTWRWEYEMNGETIKDAVRLNLDREGKLTGTYHGRSEKPVELKDAKMEGDKVGFQFPLEIQGTSLTLKFSGKVSQDELDGAVDISTGGGSQEFPWKPKRSVLLEDVVGEWQFKIETPDGNTLEPSMIVSKSGDKYVGKYKSDPNINVDAKELKVEGNQLLFMIEAEVEGNKIKASFKGRPYGDKIKGKIDYVLGDQSGEVEFTGRRKAAAK